MALVHLWYFSQSIESMNALLPKGISNLERMPSCSSPSFGKSSRLANEMWTPIKHWLAIDSVAFSSTLYRGQWKLVFAKFLWSSRNWKDAETMIDLLWCWYCWVTFLDGRVFSYVGAFTLRAYWWILFLAWKVLEMASTPAIGPWLSPVEGWSDWQRTSL